MGPYLTQEQIIANQLKDFRNLSAGYMDTQNFAKNMNSGYYTSPIGAQTCNQIPGPETQNQLLKIKEELGNLSQKLGIILPTGGVDERQLLPGNMQQIGKVANAPDIGEILQKICPGINPLQYCHVYCAKKKFEIEYVPEEGTSKVPSFTVVMKVQTHKDPPTLQTCGTDKSKKEAKQRAAEKMIPNLLKSFGPMSYFAMQSPKSDGVSTSARRATKSKKSPVISDLEWIEKQANHKDSNPTSILYNWARRKDLLAPTYEVVTREVTLSSESVKNEIPEGEEITQMAKKPKLFEVRSKMYIVQCIFEGKIFMGEDVDMKKAKVLASAAAWKEFCPK